MSTLVLRRALYLLVAVAILLPATLPATKPVPQKAATGESKAPAATGDENGAPDDELIAQASYVLGYTWARNMVNQIGDSVNAGSAADGVEDALAKKDPAIPMDKMRTIMMAFQKHLRDAETKVADANEAAAEKWLETNKDKEGIKTTDSGLQYKVVTRGTNTDHPKASDTVKVHYHGTLIDGTVFDSSKKRGQPATFPLNRVIPGWTEGVQLMSVGDTFRFYVHPKLAYGPQRKGPIPPNSCLIFDVELLGIDEPAAPAGSPQKPKLVFPKGK